MKSEEWEIMLVIYDDGSGTMMKSEDYKWSKDWKRRDDEEKE